MEKNKKQNLYFLAGLLGIGLILFWRCFYSVNTTDEAFYVGTTYRLWFGDGMLCDEWMPTQQLCSFWLYPFYALFRLILGSNEGMMLAFRFLYIVFQLVISGYLYSRLKKYGVISFLSVFLYLLSTAFNINSISYNTMANSAFLALVVTLATMDAPDVKNSILCGIFASMLVMSNPYAVAAYLLYGVCSVIVTIIFTKQKKEIPVSIRFRTFLGMSLVALGVFVVFLLFTFQNATLEDILKNLPYIINDQEHVQRWGVKFSDYLRYFREHYLWCMVVPLIASMIALFDKKREAHGKLYMGVTVLSVLPYMIFHGLLSDYVPVNLVTVPICMLGLPAVIVSKKKHEKIFYIWYVPAMIYPVLVQVASNTGPLAVSAAFMTAASASVLLTALWASEQEWKTAKYISCAVIILQLLLMLFQRVNYVWADAPMQALDTRVERGPAKGLYTTAEKVQRYNEMYDDLDALHMTEEDGFLVVGSEPLLYLYADREVASYSTWQVYTNETRLYRYYEIHDGEGKFPSVVYCVDADETIYDSILVEKLLLPMGYEATELTHGVAFTAP